MTIFRVFAMALAWAAFMGLFFPKANGQEGGMIPLDSPAGEIGGRGHWYSLRTMKSELYYTDPPVLSDIVYDDEGFPHVSGEPPVDLSLVLHPSWGAKSGEPWREAINWVREAEQMFRNSGVPIRFIIKSIQTWEDAPSFVESAYYRAPYSFRNGADMMAVLLPKNYSDPYCGVASLNGWLSVSSCSSKTLAHELGHNFGLYHSHTPGKEGRKGYCQNPSPEATDCITGTLMSYASGRIPLFASKDFTYLDQPLGTEDHDAVSYLNKAKARKALLAESVSPAAQYIYGLAHDTEEAETHVCR